MSKYQRIDDRIIEMIGKGYNTFTYLLNPDAAGAMAKELTSSSRNSGADRLVDRRLQALRKQGRITYSKGKWVVTP